MLVYWTTLRYFGQISDRGFFAISKTVRKRKLDSPAARDKLKASGKPYWRSIDPGLHLGYRKGLAGGKWVVRRYLGNEKYEVETIAAADDHSAADDDGILDFFQAQRKAREVAAKAKAPASPQGPLTVAAAIGAYFERLEHEGSKSLADARGRAKLHIFPELGNIAVADLTRDMLAKWLTALAGKAEGADAIRGRRATANRILTILRAALNQAFREGKVATDVPWRTVKPFSEVDAPRLRYFTKDEVRRLINAAQGSFRDLVKAALFTGCRYGELTRLRVGDFNPDSGTVFVGQSKSGKARHVVLTAEGQRFFETLTAGRHGDDLMLTRASGEPWGPSNATLLMSQACKAASITGGSFHILRHTAASHLVMSGVPLNVVAHNLGHADTRMTEKHYAHLAPSYVAETIRKFAPTFGEPDDSNIVSIARG
jgi:integrase